MYGFKLITTSTVNDLESLKPVILFLENFIVNEALKNT
jgi:hypothetical protein